MAKPDRPKNKNAKKSETRRSGAKSSSDKNSSNKNSDTTHSESDAGSSQSDSNSGTSSNSQTRWGLIAILLLVFLAVGFFVGRGSLATYCKSTARNRIAQFEYTKALESLEYAEQWGVDDAEVHFLKARIYRKTGKFDEFEKSIAQARLKGLPESQMNNEKLLLRGQSGKLGELLGQLEELAGGVDQFDPPEVYEALVNGFLLHGRFVQAFSYLENWEKDFPDDPNQRFYKAAVMIRFGKIHGSGDQEEVKRILEKLIDDYPKHYRAMLTYGDFLMTLNQFEKAAELLERCVELPDAGNLPRISLAECYTNLGRQEDAKKMYLEIVESEPNNALVRGELGKLQYIDEEYDEALKNLEIGYQNRPWDADLAFGLARVLRISGKESEAQTLFDRATTIQNKQGEIQALTEELDKTPDEDKRFELGKMVLQYGDPNMGVLYLRSILDKNPGHQGAKEVLTEYLSRKSATTRGFDLFSAPIRN